MRKNIVSILFIILLSIMCCGTLVNASVPVGAIIINKIILDTNNHQETVSEVVQDIDNAFMSSTFWKYSASKMYSVIQMMTGSEVIYDANESSNVYKMENGQLTFIVKDKEIEENSQGLIDFFEYLDGKGIPSLYIQAPHKINKYEELLPYDIEDTTNGITDDLLENLSDSKLDYLDLRVAFNESKYVYQDLFFNTDHHWKYSTALEALRISVDYINENYDSMDIDKKLLSEDRFDSYLIDDAFLGSQGKRVGNIYAGLDDFEYIIPIADDEIICKYFDPNWNETEVYSGSYSDAVYHMDILTSTDYMVDNYHGLLNGDGCVEFFNDKQSGNILYIRDSFGLPYSGFMSLIFNHVTVCDLRHMDNQLLTKMIEENDYDMVIVMYNPSMFGSEVMFDFN